MPLASYFSPKQITKTLNAHSRFVAPKPEWRYHNRLALYTWAELAFARHQNEASAQAFLKLFRHLKSHWQLVRPAKHFMACDSVHKLINQKCRPCAAYKPLTLANLHKTPNAHTKIVQCLAALAKVKTLPSKQPSIMAISKLLHFYNPNLFLIYDYEFVDNGLLKAFSPDWKTFSSYPEIKQKPFQNYLKYLYFANSLIHRHKAKLKQAVKTHLTWHAVAPELKKHSTNYGLVFEFLALGALHRKTFVAPRN